MMKKILFYTLLFFSSVFLSAQIYEPISWSFEQEKTGEGTANILIRAKIDKGWHLYGVAIPENGPTPTSIVFNTLKNVTLIGELKSPSKLIYEYDVNFNMQLNWYNDEALLIQAISFDDAEKVFIEGYVEYMACNDKLCLPPTQEEFSFGIDKNVEISEEQPFDSTNLIELTINRETISSEQKVENDFWKPVIDELHKFGELKSTEESLWLIFLFGLLGGALALLTPCVWPIIPMTVSFFLKRSKDNSRGRKDAFLYGISIIVIYVTLGLLITLIFGASALNELSTNAIFNVFLFALLVVFAISFFGAFDIALPASWSNKMDKKAEATAGFVSILFMAFTLALVSFSCTGPIIGLLLVQVSTTGTVLAPLVGMLGFAVALAIPFSFFALFPTFLKSLPKSGGWLNKVKVVLGFLELAFALKFLSVADLAYGWHILDREVFIALWIVIFVLLGFYFLGKIRFSHDSESKHTTVPGLFMAIFSFAFAVYMFPGLIGAPLKSISGFLPPMYTQDFNLNENVLHAQFTDFDEGMKYANEKNKPVVIDFSGFGCVNCRNMEANVWTDPRVKDVLEKDYVLITLFVDDKRNLEAPFEVEENGRTRKIKTIGDKWSYLQRYKFGANAQPFYVILDPNGIPLNSSYAYDLDPQKYLDWLLLR